MNELTDERFWAGVGSDSRYEEYLRALKDDYAATYSEEPPVLTAELRKIFTEKGSREEFEKPYFRKRKFTTDAALLALIFPENEEYLGILKKYIRSICEEYSWAVPAHCTETNDETTCVALFSCETAGMLAEISVLLKNRLGEDLVGLIEREIDRRIFTPYLSNRYWWDSGWNNWTAVCCGNIGIAMMRIAPELFERAKERILQSMSMYIGSFPNDGNCLEGLDYWHFGFGRWVWFADVLYHHSNGKYNLFNDEKVKKIASYAQKIFLKGGATVSVADSGREGRADVALLNYLHGKYPDECAVLPKEFTRNVLNVLTWLPRSRNFLYGVGVYHEKFLPKKNYYFKDSGEAIVNLEKYSLFVKAGHNGESHNHNDVGSFILSTQTGQIFCDLGTGRYFNGYFDSEIRYTLLNTASWGHSVPIVDGQYQKAGEEYCGSLSLKQNEISVDFAKAYGGAAEKLVRTFRYEEDRVLLTDEFGGCEEIVERFVTTIKPEPIAGGVDIGGVKLVCKEATPKITESSFEKTGFPVRLEKVYLIDYRFRNRVNVGFEISIP